MPKVRPIHHVRAKKDWHTCRHCYRSFSSYRKGVWHLPICKVYLKSEASTSDSCKSQQFMVGRENDLFWKLDGPAYNQEADATVADMENPSRKFKWLSKKNLRKCPILVKLNLV
ncbi:hypothetical protein INT44_006863 [Umbelopsis vinacea]|uniref:Uncharacterized protein n=1 Tax=Umbelopsis vinacea TaxID=44442 RepID=A0A8H7PIW4_9FUNG|nr:hypothetical protein INT44_006863 [Umbelopsis vinacea]